MKSPEVAVACVITLTPLAFLNVLAALLFSTSFVAAYTTLTWSSFVKGVELAALIDIAPPEPDAAAITVACSVISITSPSSASLPSADYIIVIM